MQRELKYGFTTLLAVLFTFFLHELAHWITGEALGYSMHMTLNKAYPVRGAFDQDWHYTLISSTGPVITLLQSFFAFILIRKYHSRLICPFLLSGFYLEFLSGVMNFRHANDLGRISQTFNLGLFTIPVIFVLLHVLLVYLTVQRENYSAKFLGWTFFLILLFSSVWILVNNQYHIVIL